ncbi:hypothetical protein DB346_21770 [Verrucomicrobia bacterium LW23]|nr:hypothetical protein DB346_21770 [Verrucomicrobia bacterium LW23]
MQPESKKSPYFSALWGDRGELWTPDGRLPDFSWAGYHGGNAPLPSLPRGVSVRDCGAVGDGEHDDTAAFLRAIEQAQGAIEIPAGRYVIRQILRITRPNVVLRGEGPEKSVLVCPVHLTDILPDWGVTTCGQRTSNYSWSGGIVWLQGRPLSSVLTSITGRQARGARFVEVANAAALSAGQRILIHQRDTAENSLADHLYTSDAGETHLLMGTTTAHLPCRVVAVAGNRVEIDRPLRFDIDPRWTPEIIDYQPTVTECGVEGLTFEFPETDYAGHFGELGYNAIAMENVSDCWIRNIRIHNADGGIFAFGTFCTVQDVAFTCARKPDEKSGCHGHHGVYFKGDDNLFSGFTYGTTFIHDISVSMGAGNVFSDGKGVDLCFDHHKRAPYENLFTNIDMGRSSRPWFCGGGHALGKHCAGRGTFWNLLGEMPIQRPGKGFGPHSMNLVGIATSSTSADAELEADAESPSIWLEATDGTTVQPANLHLAQLQKRRASVDGAAEATP